MSFKVAYVIHPGAYKDFRFSRSILRSYSQTNHTTYYRIFKVTFRGQAHHTPSPPKMSFNDTNFQNEHETGGTTGNIPGTFDRSNDASAGRSFNQVDNLTSDRTQGSYNSGFGSNDRAGNLSNDRTGGSYEGGLNNRNTNTAGGFTDGRADGSFGRGNNDNFSRDTNTATSGFSDRESNLQSNNLQSTTDKGRGGSITDGPSVEPREATAGHAGVMGATFGADHTSTSTFEKSQGRRYGEGFDQSGNKFEQELGGQGRDGHHRRENETERGAAAGGSGYDNADRQEYGNRSDNTTDTIASGETGSSNNSHESGKSSDHSHKEGLGQKFKEKAESKFFHYRKLVL
ncbi:hypothetical protein BGW36DRAFT_199796 [Talaromyces proteolyticus]|uniref:Uncharacterized protein n=1 Tax=Talaromyces proteolyticus TaxID=1131652 RepID=A0AAD4PZ07_9EURO|nr:uncharacterized protein BGW36DRAFT_199796 [Talaromyces proteolyticus]KAH8695277.1 hypothetical protein BGW36DRAFT_199796 [Talaromyces proteolyticus]